MTAEAIEVGSSERLAYRLAAKRWRLHLRLPPKLTLSEWADRHRVVSPPAAEAGPWRTARVPYMREIMDAISGTEYQDITVIKSSQTGGTEACISNTVGYYIDQEPSSILVIQPNVKPMAEGWSKERLAPMLADSPRLRGKVRDARARNSGNTVLHKSFPGGFLVAVGANSPAGVASWPIRIVLADELDRWPASAGTEGDPLSLAEARQITYRHSRKIVKVTTPGNAGESRGQKEWEASDQRHYYVACPHCDEWQPLEWRDTLGKPGIQNGRGDYRLVWQRGADGGHLPDTAQYQCRKCAGLIPETYKPAMLAKGRWIKHNPTSKRAGFHIGGLLSPWVRWKDIAAEWLLKKDDDQQRKAFFNTKLGLLYESEGEVPDADSLAARREDYGATPDGEVCEVPQGVVALTLAIDVQGDRLEAEVRGWGEGEESWQVRLERIYGDPEQSEVWDRAQALLDRPWRHEAGGMMRVVAAMVDSGDQTDVVYRWVRPRQARRVFAYKGSDNLKAPMSRMSRANKDGVKVFSVRPNDFKDVLFGRLKRQRPGPGYLHFGTEARTGATDEYFHQFGSEKKVVEFVKNRPVVRYVRLAHRRNEAIDLYVMNLAALRSMGMTFVQSLGKERVKTEPAPVKLGGVQIPQPQRPAPRRGSWATGGGTWKLR